jgi:predicted DNA-binding protein (MmcQ/YjbR family)
MQAAEALKAVARGFPEVEEHFPWGESAFKVRNKTFVFMYVAPTDQSVRTPGDTRTLAPGAFSVTCKLPQSRHAALMMPFAQPTGYGLGKSGWVSARFAPNDDVPLAVLEAWIDESYRAVAPKKLVAALDASRG